jgi:transcription elongation factor Elf1
MNIKKIIKLCFESLTNLFKHYGGCPDCNSVKISINPKFNFRTCKSCGCQWEVIPGGTIKKI